MIELIEYEPPKMIECEPPKLIEYEPPKLIEYEPPKMIEYEPPKMIEYEPPKMIEPCEEDVKKVLVSHVRDLIDGHMQATDVIYERLRKDRRNPALWRMLAKTQERERSLIGALVTQKGNEGK